MIAYPLAQTKTPIAAVEVVSPKVRATPVTHEVEGVVLFGLEPNLFVYPLVQGARPLAFPQIISDQPAEAPDPMEYEYPWLPEAVSGYFAGEIEWPEVDVEY
jgi:hypothetical protein